MDMIDIPKEDMERHIYGWLYINMIIIKYIIIPIIIMGIIIRITRAIINKNWRKEQYK